MRERDHAFVIPRDAGFVCGSTQANSATRKPGQQGYGTSAGDVALHEFADEARGGFPVELGRVPLGYSLAMVHGFLESVDIDPTTVQYSNFVEHSRADERATRRVTLRLRSSGDTLIVQKSCSRKSETRIANNAPMHSRTPRP